MNFLANGKIVFNDIYEMFYHLFTEIGLSINGNQYLYDQDTGIELKYKDKYIKATVQPIPIYAGRNDIVFDPIKNYNLMVSILGYYIDKESQNPNGDNIGFIAQYIEEIPNGSSDPDKRRQRVVLKTNKGEIRSQFYNNIYLGYIEIIFILSDNFIPDLSNFDCEF